MKQADEGYYLRVGVKGVCMCAVVVLELVTWESVTKVDEELYFRQDVKWVWLCVLTVFDLVS